MLPIAKFWYQRLVDTCHGLGLVEYVILLCTCLFSRHLSIYADVIKLVRLHALSFDNAQGNIAWPSFQLIVIK